MQGSDISDADWNETCSEIRDYGNKTLTHLASIRGRIVRSPASRTALLAQHNASGTIGSVRPPAQSVYYIFHRAPCSTKPLAELTKVYIEQLRWGEVERGRVLVVRTLSRPRYLGPEGGDALLTVVEDEMGTAHRLRVYNLYFRQGVVDAANALPHGAVLAIKEPYCEDVQENTSGLRIEHPSDVAYLMESDPLFPKKWKTTFTDDQAHSKSEKCRNRGNEVFKNKLYRTAVAEYSNALELDPSVALKSSILLNRAQAYLQLGCFTFAAEDARAAMTLPGGKSNEKALFRRARALYALYDFAGSLKTLEKLVEAFPQNRDAKDLLAKTKQRIEEQRSGRYDWARLIDEDKSSSPMLDIADFVGSIELVDNQFAAKENIKAGELLLCSRAFEVLYSSALRNEEKYLVYDTTRSLLGQGEGWKLTQKIALKLLDNPSFGKDLLSLWHDLNVYDKDDNEKAFNQFQVVDGRLTVDIHVIDKIREVYAIPFQSINPLFPLYRKPTQGLGIWPLGTRVYFRQSCLPSAMRSFIGNALIIRACRDISRGEHILVSHVAPIIPLEKRRAELAYLPGPLCDCRFCTIEEKEGLEVRQKRVELVQRIETLSKRVPAKLLQTGPGRDDPNRPDDAAVLRIACEVSVLCDELESSFMHPVHEQPRYPLLEPLSYLFSCYLYLGTDYTEEALRLNTRFLTALGFSFDYVATRGGSTKRDEGGDVRLSEHGVYNPLLINTLVQQSSICWQLGKRRTAECWKRIAEDATAVVAGHSRLFKEGYGGIYESLNWTL